MRVINGEVIYGQILTFNLVADVGQEEDFEEARRKALKIGASKVFIEDLRDEFVRESCFPAIQCNAIYENVYLLGTALARPVIARKQIAVARSEGAIAVSHGCTGKGNDQVRFELAYYGLDPDIQVVAPWRDPEFFSRFSGRSDLLQYAAEKGIPVAQTQAKPWSTDENIAHISYEAGILEDPNVTPPKNMFKLTEAPEDAPDHPEDFSLEFKRGVPVKLEYTDKNGNAATETEPLPLFLAMNKIARRNGIGRIDIVENRFVGVKSRGVYETPALTVLRQAHMDLEGLTLDREVRSLRDQFVTFNYARLLYNGMFFSAAMRMLQAAITESQETVNGVVRLRAYKGTATIIGRSSQEQLYDANESSMDDIKGFDPQWATGFIHLQALPLKKSALAHRQKNGKS